MTTHLSARRPAPFLTAFLRLVVPGLIGVAALFPTVRALVAGLLEQPEMRARVPAGLPLDAVAALSLIQPAALTAGAVLLGLTLAARVSLRSVLAGTASRLEAADVRVGALCGAGAAGLLLVLDTLTRPLLGPATERLSLSQPRSATELLAGVLYGGVTEELLLRFGIMTLLVWLGWRLVQRGRGLPSAGVMWGAVLLSAVVFGLAHLGAVGSLTALTPAVVIRTVGLNAVAGVVFGWLYWRRNLETGMVAHATWHVTVTALSALLAVLG